MKTLIVTSKEDGKKLNTYLTSHFPHLRQNAFYKALRKKDIRINGKRIAENIVLHTNDEVIVYIPDDILEGKLPQPIHLQVVYEDPNIAVFFKPAGMEVEGPGSFTDFIHQIRSSVYQPCHRLDRNTSGLILYAKTPEVLAILFEKFKKREIEKHYRATVIGIPKKKAAILTDFLFKDTKKSKVYVSSTPKPGYVKIITQYKVLSSDPISNTSVLDVQIHTGRTHQIRAHLAFIGYPVLGDGKYGNNETNKRFHKNKQDLISCRLTFTFSTDAGILSYLKGKTIEI